MLDEAFAKDSVEVVNGFALPLQSRALTLLLNVPESEAETWIGWGIHVFHSGDGVTKGMALENYLRDKFDQAAANPGEDFFSALTRATFHGRPLTREEMMGFGNLTFAGGRDTVIHTVSCAIAYFGANPDALGFLREDPGRIIHASEEFFRVYMPLTQIGRVCPQDTVINGHTVNAGQRVGLCWASANLDETVFERADEMLLDRKPNPHLSFGFGPHLCLGAPHARLVLRTLLRKLSDRIGQIEVIEAIERVERTESYTRPLGYDTLRVRLSK
jgi:cytochrome P450